MGNIKWDFKDKVVVITGGAKGIEIWYRNL